MSGCRREVDVYYGGGKMFGRIQVRMVIVNNGRGLVVVWRGIGLEVRNFSGFYC